jgi:hypothetical protein
MMLEADVVLGRLQSDVNERLPVMAHPPAMTSDLSLRMFLEQVVTATTQEGARKGIKLDFKSIEVVDQALTELERLQDKVKKNIIYSLYICIYIFNIIYIYCEN